MPCPYEAGLQEELKIFPAIRQSLTARKAAKPRTKLAEPRTMFGASANAV